MNQCLSHPNQKDGFKYNKDSFHRHQNITISHPARLFSLLVLYSSSTKLVEIGWILTVVQLATSINACSDQDTTEPIQ